MKRVMSMILTATLTVLGALLVASAWNAWDPLPPAGPAWTDQDRVWEMSEIAAGLLLMATGVVVASRRLLRRT
jgi:hypothetical protein